MKNVMPNVPKAPQPKIPQGSTVIAPRLKKTSIMIDSYGNQIDPVTKQVIAKAI